uniref:Uncharacterized protein LOC111131008 n=1 Tax=Crassostrea virginica TaxID=6565 RepID=A0A8B8E2U1_CRAVI|nr:uncharacterized protein LOC111131008 [Crassostrea virginica]
MECTVLTLFWIFMFWVIPKFSCSYDIECPKCLHMETTSSVGSLVKLPSNQNCSSESQSGNIKTRACPTQTSDNKMFLCGNMGGNLTVKLNLLGFPVSAQGIVFYRDCILVNKPYPLGCQQNITEAMEKSLLHELGPGVPNITVTTFEGAVCFTQSSNHATNPVLSTIRALSSDVTMQTEKKEKETLHDTSRGVTFTSTSLNTYFCFQFIIFIAFMPPF